MGLEKNVGNQKWRVFAYNRTTGAPVPGLTNVIAKIAKDWGARTTTNDVVATEQEDGYYTFDLTQAESNAKVLDIYPESATVKVNVIGVPGTIYTVAPGASDMTPLPRQNVALSNIPFVFFDSDHNPVTGATGISATRNIDGGAFAAITGSIAEIANGLYQLDASAADVNGGIITFRIIATGGTPGAPEDVFLTIVTGAGT